jgi:hypothetical protein
MIEQVIPFVDGMAGIITLPSKQVGSGTMPCLVFLNADPLHSGIHVKLCRALAQQGIVSFRFDLSGSGDSLMRNDARPIKDIWIEDTVRAIDHLANTQQFGSFVVIGICKGARIAAEVGLSDSRVVGIVPINLDSPAATVSKKARVRYWMNPRWWAWWGVGKIPEKLMVLAGIRKKQPQAMPSLHAQIGDFFGSGEAEIVNVWQKVQQQSVPTLAVFSEFDRHYDFFRLQVEPKIRSNDFLPALKLAIIRNADHNMTIPATQVHLRRALSDWLFQEFESGGESGDRIV